MYLSTERFNNYLSIIFYVNNIYQNSIIIAIVNSLTT